MMMVRGLGTRMYRFARWSWDDFILGASRSLLGFILGVSVSERTCRSGYRRNT